MIIGLIGSCLIIILLIVKKCLDSFVNRLILYIAICDLGGVLTHIIGPYSDKEESYCILQGWGISFFKLSMLMIANYMCIVIHAKIFSDNFESQKKYARIKNYEVCIVIGIVLFCCLIALLPLTTDSYVETTLNYCWIATNQDERWLAFMWQCITIYGFLWVSTFSTLVIYCLVHNEAKRQSSIHAVMGNSEYAERVGLLGNLRLYPIAIILCWSPATVNRIYLYAFEAEPVLWLTVCQIVFMNLIGMVHFVIYMFNPRFKQSVENQNKKEVKFAYVVTSV